jgi:nitrite reductase (NO-forming)
MNVTLPAHRKLSAATLLVTGAALLAGCGSSSSSGGGGTTTTTTPTTNPPTGTTQSGGSGGGTMVGVTLENYKIIVAGGDTLKPGTYTFHVSNKGPSDHNLTINGPGVSNQATSTFPEGQTQNLTVTLKNGNYAFYCSVPGHKELGMDVMVKVGTGGSDSSASGGGTSSASSSSGGGWS